MRTRAIGFSLLAAALAVLLQTTLFAQVRIFEVAPDLVMLTVIAVARRLDAEPAVLLGFTSGLAMDLLGSSPLGLRALVLTLIAHATVRTKDRFDVNIVATGSAAVLLSMLGVVLVVVIGTLFGEASFRDPNVFRKILLIPVYNLVLAIGIFPLVTLVLGGRRRRELLL
ncbi:MAG: rod shape-determining protein MreD [Acidimicrobiia bacterium]|nr:rod shape-determining protein MreD [Acidimicrobiia bacterium]MDH5616067.1 rod shape-determining protein MreD [Acidimicrobiia bacterium]